MQKLLLIKTFQNTSSFIFLLIKFHLTLKKGNNSYMSFKLLHLIARGITLTSLYLSNNSMVDNSNTELTLDGQSGHCLCGPHRIWGHTDVAACILCLSLLYPEGVVLQDPDPPILQYPVLFPPLHRYWLVPHHLAGEVNRCSLHGDLINRCFTETGFFCKLIKHNMQYFLPNHVPYYLYINVAKIDFNFPIQSQFFTKWLIWCLIICEKRKHTQNC